MGNQKKSTCQLRLEARSRAYRQQTAAAACAPASSSSTGANSNEQLAAQMHSRIARATELRVAKQRAREAQARERVLHAQRVAREQHAKRREQRSSVCVASRAKVEIARQRRRAQLERLQQSCKTRVAHVREKVQTVRDGQRRRSETARRVLQTQLVEAARRREEQTQRMVRRLSERWQSVESVKDRVARAKFIQRWYRRHVDARKTAHSLRGVARDVACVAQCWQQIAVNGFEPSMQLLQDRTLARAAQSVLRVLLPSAANQSPSSGGGNKSPTNSGASFRVLLLAGMIAYHPSEIMESGQCDRLAFAARAMTKDLQRIDVLLASGAGTGGSTARALKTGVARLEAHFAFYFGSFSRWKRRDAARLATEMLQSYDAIYVLKRRYAAQQPALDRSDGAHELAFQTEKQLQQLKGALAHVLGRDEALARVAAVERSVEQRDDERMSSSSSNSSESDGNEGDNVAAEPQVAVAPVITPASGSDSVGDAATQQQQQQERPPEQIESLLADEKLVHELIVNPSFRLPEPPSGESADDGDGDGGVIASFAARVRDTMHRAFWDQVVAANDIMTLLARTDELRDRFASVASLRRALVDDVNHALARHALEPLLCAPETHVHDIAARCARVLRAILQAEAPVRTESTHAFLSTFERRVAALQAPSSTATIEPPVRLLVDFLAFALQKVDVMRVDVVNAHVQLLATYLQRHGVAYEQTKLNAQLEAGVPFAQTRAWLAAEMQHYWPALSADAKDRMARYDAHAFAQFLRHSVLALVHTHIAGAASRWPESFRMDVDRVRGFRDTMDRVTVVASLLAVLHEYATRRRLVVPRDLFGRVAQQLSALLVSSGISGAHLVDRAVDEMRQLEATRLSSCGGASASADVVEQLQALEQRLQSAFSASSPVFNLFAARVANAVAAAQFGDADAVEIHASLAPFADEIRALALAIRRLATHNERVHAALYNSIVKQLVSAM